MTWRERIKRAEADSGRFLAEDIIAVWSDRLGPATELGLAPEYGSHDRWLADEIGWAVLSFQPARALQRFEELRARAERRRRAA